MKTTKRSFMAATLLTVCGLASAQSRAGDPVSITLVDTDAGANIQLLFKETVIPAAEKELNIKVNYVVSKGSEMLERIKGWGNRQGDFEILHVKPDEAVAFFAAGVPLVKLTDNQALIPNLAKVNKDVMQQVLGENINGRATSMFRFTMALMYNADKVPNPPKSWKEFYARRAEWKGHIGMIRTDAKSTGGRRTFYTFMDVNGVDLSKPVADILKSPAYLETEKKFQDFSTYFYNPMASEAPVLFQQFKDNEVWLAEFALDATLSSRDLGMLPASVKGLLLAEGETGGANAYFLIPANIDAKKKEAALKFINVAISNDVQRRMAERFYLYPSTDIAKELPPSLWKIVPPLESLKVRDMSNAGFMTYIKEKGMSVVKQ